MRNSPVGIFLAAGKSLRFGSNKLLHPVSDSTPMFLVCAQKLASVLPGSIAVISPELKNHTAQLEQLGLRVVVNEQAEQGMGSSIACGVNASQDASGWLITLADMPYIKKDTLAQLVNRLNDGVGIIAPMFGQQRGHPVGFNNAYKNELLALSEDVGARHIINIHQDQLELLPTHDEGVIRDVDQPEDLDRLKGLTLFL